MAGIYLHIPFCKKACHYCNFHFSTGLSGMHTMVEALKKELIIRKNYLTEPLSTIYFGGGTPSLLPEKALAELLDTIAKNYTLEKNIDISFEVNPDDIEPVKLLAWRQAGINRLSIGIQSFDDEELIWMNRAHNANHAKSCINAVREAGFENFSVDLIYGSPLLTTNQWEKNMQIVFEAAVPHLSCYALTVEPKTTLSTKILQQKNKDIDPEKQAVQFLLLMQKATEAGYEHYEISNFAKPGMRSKHNSSYWQGKHYLGIGPSAHSFNGYSREWNIANNALYVSGIEAGAPANEIEVLTQNQQINEYIMTSLRTLEGLSLAHIEQLVDTELAALLLKEARPFIAQKKIIVQGRNLVLTNEGKLFADGIASDLFMV